MSRARVSLVGLKRSLRYGLVKVFYGDRSATTLTGRIEEFVKGSGSATMEEIRAKFSDVDWDVARNTVYNLAKNGTLRRIGDVYYPAETVSIFSYRFGIRVAGVGIPFATMLYVIQTGGQPAFFLFAFLMFALGVGSLVETAFS